ncbi:MAG: hypothetical protein WCW53_00010 [Syntrophales bacterium]
MLPGDGTITSGRIVVEVGVPRLHDIAVLRPDQPRKVVHHRQVAVVRESRVRPVRARPMFPILPRPGTANYSTACIITGRLSRLRKLDYSFGLNNKWSESREENNEHDRISYYAVFHETTSYMRDDRFFCLSYGISQE